MPTMAKEKTSARSKSCTGKIRYKDLTPLLSKPKRDDYPAQKGGHRHFQRDMNRWKFLLKNPPEGAPSRGRMNDSSYEIVLEEWLHLRDAVNEYLSRYRTNLSFKEKDTIAQFTPQQLQIPTGSDVANYNVLQWATKGELQIDLLEYFSLLSNNTLSYGPCQFFMQEIRDISPDSSSDTTDKTVFADTNLWRCVPPFDEEFTPTHPMFQNIVRRMLPTGVTTLEQMSSILIIGNGASNSNRLNSLAQWEHPIAAVVTSKDAVITTFDPLNDELKAKMVFDMLCPVLNVILTSEGQMTKNWKHKKITAPLVPHQSKSSCCGLLAVTNGILVALSLEKSIDLFKHNDLPMMAE